MGTCPGCGNDSATGSRYCPHCGAPPDLSDQETFGKLIAYIDPLTGLHDRRYLVHELGRHIEIYKRYRHPFSLLVIDVARLAWVNDTFGRAAGDSALRHLASLVETNVRGVDIPCRYGGDEFVVIAPETDKLGIQVVGRRISELVKKTGFKIGRAFATVEVSFGTSSCPEDGIEAEGLLQLAAERHKRRGDNEGPGGEGGVPDHRPPRRLPPHSRMKVSPPREG